MGIAESILSAVEGPHPSYDARSLVERSFEAQDGQTPALNFEQIITPRDITA